MDEMQEPLFTTVKLEDFVQADHPLRPVRLLVNQALKRLNGLFSIIDADTGRPTRTGKSLRDLTVGRFCGATLRNCGAARSRFPDRWSRQPCPTCVCRDMDGGLHFRLAVVSRLQI
jgi:hypothetical protein